LLQFCLLQDWIKHKTLIEGAANLSTPLYTTAWLKNLLKNALSGIEIGEQG
jgi:hypothetical protein